MGDNAHKERRKKMLEYTIGLILQLCIFVGIPALVWGIEEMIKKVLGGETYAEEKEERYEKYRSMFEEMKKG